ncbi:glycosyltransferase family 4 protein [Alteribacillus iranensis]|uniref:Galacturonosyltransferase n=1 Tax=Alteribacillus iranensis TaxID=930128 RepID=A0A1I2BHJ1_9BACI|nr:glycosyltransferase family 4 protein [Alteribacillus iranensis]SFE55407.1 galacturonosyltransferase [Alteribacillus iranensis]
MKKVLVLANHILGIYSFRRELVQRLLDEGYEVLIAAPSHEKMSYFKQVGCKCIETPIRRRGANPITDFKLILNYYEIIKENKPHLVLTYTIKPNVYGGFVSRFLRIPYIANVTGVGTSIENKGFIRKISLELYRIGLKRAKCVFFQNEHNRSFFYNNDIVIGKTKLIPGSGVNLLHHTLEEYPSNDRVIKFLFIGRMMKDKGINELLIAASKVKEIYPNVQFDLIGRIEDDFNNLLKEYENNEIIKYHGRQNNVHSFIKDCHAVINPSYHEGMSNVLLESASTGRPVLASKIPGCRETFEEGVSGFGFEVRNADDLVETIIKFIRLPYVKKKMMGIAGRKKIEKEFDRNIVIDAYMHEINKVTGWGK